MARLHTVIDAGTGRTVVEGFTTGEFDRWYDHHCFWRKPRRIEDVAPELRARFTSNDEEATGVHFLVED